MFERYNLITLAVVDGGDRLVGVITADDVVDVVKEEAEEDMRALGGVGDEEISDPVWYTARNRFRWLFVNLLTAFLAAAVIGAFEATIEKPDVTLAEAIEQIDIGGPSMIRSAAKNYEGIASAA